MKCSGTHHRIPFFLFLKEIIVLDVLRAEEEGYAPRNFKNDKEEVSGVYKDLLEVAVQRTSPVFLHDLANVVLQPICPKIQFRLITHLYFLGIVVIV